MKTQQPGLKRQMGLLEVFCIASGAMISSGLFVLPSLAFDRAGPGMIFSYTLASLIILPSVFTKAELSTAMPRAGGAYFYIQRSFGPAWGLFSGLAAWFSLALKSAFAVVGLAVFIQMAIQQVLPVELGDYSIRIIAAVCCVGFTALNLYSVRHTTGFQVWLVIILLAILTVFIVFGFPHVEVMKFDRFLRRGWIPVLSTAGLVFISYGGLTKVASVAEEVEQPGRTLTVGMLSAWFIVSLLYIAVVAVTVGVTDPEALRTSLAPISLAAGSVWGPVGFGIVSVAAVAAFVSTANGGILAASRSPLAMSRDLLLPQALSRVHPRWHTPVVSILFTGGFMVAAILVLDLESLVKTASTLMIILFILENASVIIMRESRIQTYQPRFRSPFYPWVQIVSIVLYSLLIVEMGVVPLSISAGFVVLSVAWYFFYVRDRARRDSAAMHVVKRVTDRELGETVLEDELRDILIERDEIVADRFDRLIAAADVLDIEGKRSAEVVFLEIAGMFSRRLGVDEHGLFEQFLRREAEGSTVITPGLAIPHIVVPGEGLFDIVLVRSAEGIEFPHAQEPVHAIFVLVGSRDERNFHLRALMAIAQVAQQRNFEQQWLQARGPQGLKNLILLTKRKREAE